MHVYIDYSRCSQIHKLLSNVRLKVLKVSVPRIAKTTRSKDDLNGASSLVNNSAQSLATIGTLFLYHINYQTYTLRGISSEGIHLKTPVPKLPSTIFLIPWWRKRNRMRPILSRMAASILSSTSCPGLRPSFVLLALPAFTAGLTRTSASIGAVQPPSSLRKKTTPGE